MFKLDPNPTFSRTVEVLVPADGGHRKDTIGATFRVIDTERATAFDHRKEADTTNFLREVVVKLDDIADMDGKPIPYSDAVRDQLFRLPYARVALCRSYFEALLGAQKGN